MKRILILLIFVIPRIANTQDNKEKSKAATEGTETIAIKGEQKLLYYAIGSNTLLVPVIEEILQDLKFAESDRKIFKKVRGLNRYLLGKDATSSFQNTWAHFDRGLTEASMQKEKVSSAAAKIDIGKLTADALQENDLFFLIQINKYDAIYEYQFVLCRFVIDKYDNANLITPDFTVYRSTSVLIDLTKNTYRQEFLAAINGMINEANDKPVPVMTSPSHAIGKDGEILVAIGDTLRMEGASIDPDSPADRMKYILKVNGEREEGFKYTSYKENNAAVVFYNEGDYVASLSVTDGISEFTTVNYKIRAIEPPSVRSLTYLYDRKYVIPPFDFVPITYRRDRNQVDVYLYGDHDYYRPPKGLYITFRLNDISLHDRLYFEINDDKKTTVVTNIYPYTDINPDISEVDQFDRRKFNVMVNDTLDQIRIYPPEKIDRPSSYEIKMTPSYKGVLGESRFTQINFHRTRRISFQVTQEFFPYKSELNLLMKGGVGYTYFLHSDFLSKVWVTYGWYGMIYESPDFTLNSSQEVYGEFSGGGLPLSLKIGLRRNTFEVFDGERIKDQSELYVLTGLDVSFRSRQFQPRIFFNYADTFVSNLIRNQFTFGITLEMMMERR